MFYGSNIQKRHILKDAKKAIGLLPGAEVGAVDGTVCVSIADTDVRESCDYPRD